MHRGPKKAYPTASAFSEVGIILPLEMRQARKSKATLPRPPTRLKRLLQLPCDKRLLVTVGGGRTSHAMNRSLSEVKASPRARQPESDGICNQAGFQ